MDVNIDRIEKTKEYKEKKGVGEERRGRKTGRGEHRGRQGRNRRTKDRVLMK